MRYFPFLLLLFCTTFLACGPDTNFEKISSFKTGIKFNNKLEETEMYNMVSFSNFYTGGGVGIGDINNDGLMDIFFGGNMISSRLYLNKGNFQFEDISEKAGLIHASWATGISMVDINADGWLDIYISTSGHPYSVNKNLLYINQGDNTFKEKAGAYGLDLNAQVTHSSFFDYDNDGDLDVFMALNPTDFQLHMMGRISSRRLNGTAGSTDKLYRNNGNNTFTDVSKNAGILIEGYSLGLHTADFNNDGCIDIFVGNDYVTNDILYINNCDGTFTDQLDSAFQHTSFASMGTDVGDFNNDGLLDIVTVDMYPEDSYREKMLVAGGINSYYMLKKKGYVAQHTRNVLYLNNGDGTYNEIGRLANIHRTDWSWSPLFADFDNDGLKDLYITNGFAKEVGNLDFISYNEKSPFANPTATKAEKIQAIVEQEGKPIVNYAFRNQGDFTFKKVSKEWGMDQASISSGAAYADLDNDGDLDMVVNNINQEAFIYKNNTKEIEDQHFIAFQLQGTTKNPNAIGAKVTIYHDNTQQLLTVNPYRGYISSVDQRLYFGLGEKTTIDSVKIRWPNGKLQVLKGVTVDQILLATYDEKALQNKKPNDLSAKLLKEKSATRGIIHQDQSSLEKDFYTQPMAPRVHSHAGPALAVGDINMDGKEDLFIGAPEKQSSVFFIQKADGQFQTEPFPHDARLHDVGTLLFDCDGDNDLDLYIVSGTGSNKTPKDSSVLQDRLYLNDGQGNWNPSSDRLPNISSSGSCVVASDYDKDGDLDLFIGGKNIPGHYPFTPQSYLLQNNGGYFKDITSDTEGLENIGMVNSALWTDYDNDGWIDLMIVGEWMAIEVFHNQKGKLVQQTISVNLDQSNGWWNSLTGADFDMDGDIDYVLGNQGLNTHYQASYDFPFCLYAKDFDNNGTVDPILCQYVKGENYPVALRGEMIQQLPSLRKRFPNYQTYASSTFNEVFTKEELEGSEIFTAYILESSYLENLGDGTFKRTPLPKLCQSAPINGLQVTDLNQDGWLDILVIGNDFSNEVFHGWQDGMDGLCLINKGDGTFEAMNSLSSGFKVSGDAKALVELSLDKDKSIFVVSKNHGTVLSFEKENTSQTLQRITANPNQSAAIIHLKDGRSFRHEFYYGSGYLSQGSRALSIYMPIENIEFK